MKTAAVLIAVAAGLAVALLNERWASPWTDALARKNRDDMDYGRLWAIIVVGSGMITYLIIEPVLLAWLK
jgi:hypothetical protein